MLGQTEKVSFSYQNQADSSYNHTSMSGNEVQRNWPLDSTAVDLDFGVTQKDCSSVTCRYKLQRHYLIKPSFFAFRVMTSSESYITPTVFHKLNMFCVDFASCLTQTVCTRSIRIIMHDRVIKCVKENNVSKLR